MLVTLALIVSLAAVTTVWAGSKIRTSELQNSNASQTPPEHLIVDYTPEGPALPPEVDRNPREPLDTPIGSVYAAGTTWYDYQHNGSAGKMIAVDNAGFVHLVWMNALNSGINPRHVYYNVWDPGTEQMMMPTPGGGGVQINTSVRAGYICQAVTSGGWAFPAFHEIRSGETDFYSAAAIDFLPRVGAFTTYQPAHLAGLLSGWPKIALGRDSVLHMVSTHSVSVPSGPQPFAYSRGIPLWDLDGFGMSIDWQPVGPGFAEYLVMDTTYSISPDIACSKISDRVAIAWTRIRPQAVWVHQWNNDVFYMLSENGGLTWGAPVNLTQFSLQDTHRAYTDVSVVFDEQDNLHIAFTTHQCIEQSQQGDLQYSLIWHWSEATQQFGLLANGWYHGFQAQTGIWNHIVGRPSLSIDPQTDFVYCSYQRFDTTAWSDGGYFNSDVWVTASTDGGLNWSVGRNVTDTQPVFNPAPAGESRSERDITLADRVTYPDLDGFLHLEWELDLDAGSMPQNEGVATQNTIYYQRFRVIDIPLSPLLPSLPFHIVLGRCCYGDISQPICAMNSFEQCLALAGDWDSTLTCDTQCPGPAQGRCCYGDENAPSCLVTSEEYCATLAGTWDGTLTCTTPCPPPTQGRCCYGDPNSPSCAMTGEAVCSSLAGDWDSTLTCTTPCPFVDTSQPDTILYDDGIPALFYTATNYWVRVRFTPLTCFELHSAYLFSINGSDNPAPCSVFVHLANGNLLGTLLSANRLQGLVADIAWNALTLEEDLTFTANQDFYIVIGPVPGGAMNQGWHVVLDNQNSGRSGIAMTGHNGSYITAAGDFMIRAGGEYFESFSGAVTLLSGGPPDWIYSLTHEHGCITRLSFTQFCPGTIGSVVGNATANWSVFPNGDANDGDSIVFVSSIPLSSGSIAGFVLSHSICSGDVIWGVGDSSGIIGGPLPVELTSFEAIAEAGGIRVRFHTASETDNDHFEIMRGNSAAGAFAPIAVLPSQGNSSTGHAYSHLDEAVTVGETYWYYLVDVDVHGNRSEHRNMMVSATALDPAIPSEYSLSVYPNPFNPVTTIHFGLKESGEVTLAIYNIHGQWMQNLTHRHYEAGTYSIAFSADELPSGIYFARLDAGVFVQTKKLMLLK